MNFMNKLERKFSKYAVSNLTLYLIFGYVIGYVLSRTVPGMLEFLILDPYQVLHGQVCYILCYYDAFLLPARIESGTDMGSIPV